MGFFSSFDYQPEPAWREREQPVWMGPPKGVVPATSEQRAVVFHTSTAFLQVTRFDVYPTGVEFVQDLYVEPGSGATDPWDLYHQQAGQQDPKLLPGEYLRFGVELANGNRWSNIPSPNQFPGREPTFVVLNRGGGGGDGYWQMQWWLWPLPPPGPLTFFAEWPSQAIPECSATVDAAELHARAEDARALWA